jgi:hypothetical protein
MSSKNGTGQPELNQGTPPTETPAAAQETPPVNPVEGTPPPQAGEQGQDGEQEDNKKNEPDPNRKIGLVTFLQLSGTNKYTEAMLRSKNAMEAHTKAEWDQIVNDLLKKKVK